MVDLKVVLEQVCQMSFNGNEMLKNAQKDGFDLFLNSDQKPDESAR
jgi:Cullin family